MKNVAGLLLLTALALSGCATPEQAAPPADADRPVPALSPESSSRAEALALFSQGLIDEQQRNPAAALTKFQQAVQLDPDN